MIVMPTSRQVLLTEDFAPLVTGPLLPESCRHCCRAGLLVGAGAAGSESPVGRPGGRWPAVAGPGRAFVAAAGRGPPALSESPLSDPELELVTQLCPGLAVLVDDCHCDNDHDYHDPSRHTRVCNICIQYSDSVWRVT